MTETVTSKFSLQYLVKIPAIIGFLVLVLTASVRYANSLGDEVSSLEICLMSLVLIGLIAVVLYFSPPTKIIVSKDHIILNNYLSRKQRVIQYTDIAKTNTMRINQTIKGGTSSNYQRLQITLNNEDVISFNETDYDNYNALKAAIYDHKFRGL